MSAVTQASGSTANAVKPLSGEFEGVLRVRVGNHCVFFDETASTVTIRHALDQFALKLQF